MQSIADMARTMNIRPQVSRPAPAVKKRSYEIPDRCFLSDLDTSHHPMLAVAVQKAKEWQIRRAEQAERGDPTNASLVLVASQSTLPDGRPDPARPGTGCGKTHIAKSILWSICHLLQDTGEVVGYLGQFYEAGRLIEELDTEGDVANALRGRPILVIDDIGTEGNIEFIAATRQASERQARYYRVINYCYEYGVSVIITSNLTFPELAEHLGKRVMSRLQEMAPTGFMLDLTGVPDYRRRVSGRC